MKRRPTVGEKIGAGAAELRKVARLWIPDASEILLGFLWGALPGFLEVIGEVEITGDEEELERWLTQHLEPEIRDVMDPYSPFRIQHAPREFETRLGGRAQAPEYDLGFVLREEPRVIWPIEAKVIPRATQTAEYVKEILENFLTCRRAPFSSEAAMIAYLLKGKPEVFFGRVSERVPCAMERHPAFNSEPHRRSDHVREIPPGSSYQPQLHLNHLVFVLY